MIKACIFDLDGTLTDTLSSIVYSANSSLRKEGLSELPGDNFRYYAGDGARELVRRYLKDTHAVGSGLDPHDERNFEHFFRSYMEEFSKYCMYRVKPFDGIPELIHGLHERDIRTAVLSNKPDAQTKEVVSSVFSAGDFDHVQGQLDGMPRKPAPDGALHTAGIFGIRPDECMYVGDTNTDMQTGKAAGMYTVGVLWGFRDRAELEANKADAIVSAPGEILGLLKAMNA